MQTLKSYVVWGAFTASLSWLAEPPIACAQATITVTAPNTWTILDPGPSGNRTTAIRWNSARLVGNVSVHVSRDGGASWQTLFAGIPNTGMQNWVISGPATPRARVRVQSAVNAQVSDISNTNFCIIGPYYKGFPGGYCTNRAAREFDAVAPSPGLNWSGNAGAWYINAAGSWKVTTDRSRGVNGAIAVWSGGGFGHVGTFRFYNRDARNQIVSAVFDEMNWGTVIDSSWGITSNFGAVTRVTLPITNYNRGGYTFTGFVLPQRR